MRVLLVEKQVKYEKEGKALSFPKIIGKVEKVVNGELKIKWFDINFKKETREKLNKEMIKNDLTYPVAIEVEDNENSYFVVQETSKNGFVNTKLVILDYVEVEEAPIQEEIKKNRINIDDLFN